MRTLLGYVAKSSTLMNKKEAAMRTMKDQVSREDLQDAIVSIKLRAEKQPKLENDLQYFVQIIDFAALSAPNTQIIYGRNGTGKTHLLKAFYQYCESNFEDNKILPVYIDFKNLDLGPVLPRISLDDLILRFYRLFLRKIIDRLKEFSDKVITMSLLEKVFGGESKSRKQKIDESIEKLNSLLNMEQIEEQVKEYVRKVEKGKEGSSKIGGRVGISSQISTSKPEAQIGAGFEISAEEVEKAKETIELIYRGLAVINYESIRNELESIVEQCGAKAIILLVDEWSSVSLSIQPYLAEMIRKTIAVSNKVFLKIVTLKYLTQTSAIVDPPQRIGFQSGVDIIPLADLDLLLNYDIDQQGVKDFLTMVAYKHTCLELPALKEYSVTEFEDYLCSELFEKSSVYFELVRSSEGNPRDFLSVLSSCCITARLGDSKKISQKQVIEAAARFFTESKSPEIKNYPQANTLFNKIFRKVVQNRHKLFLISAEKAEYDRRIQALWHYRFIHLVMSSFTTVDEDRIPHEYAVYSMDYGKLLSLKVDKAGQELVGIISTASSFSLATSVISTIIIRLYGRSLKQIMGRKHVSRKGVEAANLADVNYLVKNCIFDDLL